MNHKRTEIYTRVRDLQSEYVILPEYSKDKVLLSQQVIGLTCDVPRNLRPSDINDFLHTISEQTGLECPRSCGSCD